MNQSAQSSPLPEKLETAFKALAPLLPNRMPRAAKQSFTIEALTQAFVTLQEPLELAKNQGRLINPWAITGIKSDEARNSSALAGLWQLDFGGSVSRNFLVNYLRIAIDSVNWHEVLRSHYHVETECNPIGDRSDRVDIVVEAQGHVVGIEIKIYAALGAEQLERYISSINRRASLCGSMPHVILLAPFTSPQASVSSTTWADVARAAYTIKSPHQSQRSFIENLIVSFGDHVMSF